MINDKTKKISLFGLNQIALIILSQSGVVYDNQVGGNFCLQRSEEGFLAIIFDCTGMILKELAEYTVNKLKLNQQDADHINDILCKYSSTCMLTVDKSRLEDSSEAWIYVEIANREELIKKLENSDVFPSYDFLGFSETKGVLTWNNSD